MRKGKDSLLLAKSVERQRETYLVYSFLKRIEAFEEFLLPDFRLVRIDFNKLRCYQFGRNGRIQLEELVDSRPKPDKVLHKNGISRRYKYILRRK